ncbi:hypothetical protein CAP36_09725 [Chitinophagaceae bacterium IBVUCB2]|nr:hypothetical protein CAP36_09725 [Chitinophagaceae bacterium IBVUCB2]
MKYTLEKIKNDSRIKKGYLTGFVFLLIACLITLYANRQLIRQSARVAHTHKVISILENLFSTVKDAETGVRGYLINHDSSFLQPYIGSNKSIDSMFNIVKEQTSDNELQQNRLIELKEKLNERYNILQSNIDIYNRNRKIIVDTIFIQQVKGKRIMDDVRNLIGLMKKQETDLLTGRNKLLSHNFRTLNSIIISTITVAVIIVVFGFITHTKESKARREAEKKIITYEAELKNRIADLHKANEELIQMRSQEKFAATGRMARTIAHEVRNPLTNINLAVDQLKGEIRVPEENTNFLFEMIGRNSYRINQLISDLLNSTKFSELSFNKISINELLDETLVQAEDRIKLINVEIIRNYSQNIKNVSVDKERLKIALLNIIINALEAMEGRAGSKLVIETKEEEGKCKISISDNGPGMDEDSLSKIFEPYFTSKQTGNGLGLTNTQNIILNHKGDINVSSKVNQGTNFIIRLNFA